MSTLIVVKSLGGRGSAPEPVGELAALPQTLYLVGRPPAKNPIHFAL